MTYVFDPLEPKVVRANTDFSWTSGRSGVDLATGRWSRGNYWWRWSTDG